MHWLLSAGLRVCLFRRALALPSHRPVLPTLPRHWLALHHSQTLVCVAFAARLSLRHGTVSSSPLITLNRTKPISFPSSTAWLSPVPILLQRFYADHHHPPPSCAATPSDRSSMLSHRRHLRTDCCPLLVQPRITPRCQHPISPIEDLFSDCKLDAGLSATATHPRLIMVRTPHTAHYIPLISLVIVRSPKFVTHPSHGQVGAKRSDGVQA